MERGILLHVVSGGQCESSHHFVRQGERSQRGWVVRLCVQRERRESDGFYHMEHAAFL
jgi:hypothetical protein